MSCKCYFIPKYLEDKANEKSKDFKNKDIGDELRILRKSTSIDDDIDLKDKLKKNYIYNGKNRKRLPGKLISSSLTETSFLKDHDALTVSFFTDYFIRFCETVLKDNYFGKEIKSTIHYSNYYNNAFFDGTQMVYGDGDGSVFENFAQDPSVIFHELFHCITDRSCKLVYDGQSGSLAESLSDVFASIIIQWMNGETVDEASWLIGERCIIDTSEDSYALRSLSDPGTAFIDHKILGTDKQISDMDNYKEDIEDIHTNCSIPNHAFYLFAKSIGDNSWEIPCNVWYKTITTPGLITPNCTFAEFAEATITTASDLYEDESISSKVQSAWESVKVI